MADESQQERTEQATPKRREEARRRGQLPRSQELVSAAIILGGTAGLWWFGSATFSRLRAVFPGVWVTDVSSPLSADGFYALAMDMAATMLWAAVPVMAWCAVIGASSLVGQHGVVWTVQPMTPDWSRLNPVAGIRRILSANALADLVKTLFKFGALGWVAYLAIRSEWTTVLTAIQSEPIAAATALGRAALHLGVGMGVVVLAFGVADFVYQRWMHERRLRMSRQDLREELKETEGAPLVKTRIRSLQRQKAKQRMMAEVPKADVVLTNPTTLAVALAYRRGEMDAPTVVAKGAGLIAMRIREIARANGVPVLEQKALARTLFRTVDVGEVIPSSLYRAVAEILAYVYRIRRQWLEGGHG